VSLVIINCVGFAPDISTLLITSPAEPVFFTVTVCAVLALPTGTGPNSRDSGDTTISGVQAKAFWGMTICVNSNARIIRIDILFISYLCY
jgi:hypothetical protein